RHHPPTPLSPYTTLFRSAQNPDVEQPFAELGLKHDEYLKIREVLGRRPTSAELAMYSVMWSEHCSYKSSKVHLRKFGDNVTDDRSEEHTSELQSRFDLVC